jgi:glycosyltransferase involved in cell wall biosynthesis
MNKILVYKTKLLARSETFIKEQVAALERWQGVLVGVTRTNNGLDLGGIEVRLLEDLKRTRWQRFRWRLARHFDRAPPGVVERLEAEGAQLLHIHFGTEAVNIWPVAERLGIPVLVTLHGFDINTRREWWESGKGGSWMRGYPRRLLHLAESPKVRFIAVSEAIRTRAIEFGIPAEKVIVRYTGIDLQKFTPAGEPIDRRARRVLFVGRLVENKGVAHLIRAFAKTREAVPDAELRIIGDGPLRAGLEKLAEALGCPVQFRGSQPPESVKTELDGARVFALPSVTIANGNSEGLGMVLLEAEACGVPAVTSSRGGAGTAVIDCKTGFTHAEGDEERLASALIRLLTDDDLAREFSRAARRHVEHHFDIRQCSHALEATYDEIVRAHAAGGASQRAR